MNLGRYFDSLSIKFGLVAILALSGCIATTLPYMRAETAQRIAAPAWMIKRDISASPFMLRAYERIHDRGGIANIYIEGNGAEYTSPREWKDMPTPKNPVALHLASKDGAKNVIYLARPCQYTGMLNIGEDCDETYWKDSRYSAEVIESYKIALDNIARRYGIHGFNLIGYSGGAAIAAILAAERKDVLSLRTVAGILDHEAMSAHLKTAPLTNSISPVDKALDLVRMPQYHFIGGQDFIVPPSVLHGYLQAMPPTNCVQTKLVQEASYDKGWVDKWPELLDLPVRCYGSNIEMPKMKPYTPAGAPTTISRPKPVKP